MGRGWTSAPEMLRSIGEQRQMPCPLEGDGQPPLVLGASASLPAGFDLPPVRQVTSKPIDVLVVYLLDLLSAEKAHLPPRGVARFPSLGSGRCLSRALPLRFRRRFGLGFSGCYWILVLVFIHQLTKPPLSGRSLPTSYR